MDEKYRMLESQPEFLQNAVLTEICFGVYLRKTLDYLFFKTLFCIEVQPISKVVIDSGEQ